MVSRYLHLRDWVVILVVQLCLVRSDAEYVWDGSEWKWQDDKLPDDTVEASGEDPYYGGGGRYRGGADDDEDDDIEGSGGHDFSTNVRTREQNIPATEKDLITIDPGEIDPRDVDIGFEELTTRQPSTQQTTPVTTQSLVPETTQGKDPQVHHNHETNFFAQPGILAAVVGGTVVGLLCTILLVMLIVYRMRKADEGSYSLNEPKRSPNVHSYLKAPSREFFA